MTLLKNQLITQEIKIIIIRDQSQFLAETFLNLNFELAKVNYLLFSKQKTKQWRAKLHYYTLYFLC